MSVRLDQRRPAGRRSGTVWSVLVLTATLLFGGGDIAAAKAPVRQPVVFVHGLFGSPDNFDEMRTRFTSSGYEAGQLYSFGYDSTGSMTVAAEELSTEIDRVLRETGATKVDVVTHSLGGLPSRWYVKFLGGLDTVDDWVSLGGPNKGGAPGTCPAPGSVACDQATAGSAFITKLNSGDPTPAPVNYATFFSACDGVVEPDWTTLEGAKNNDVGCVDHFSLLSDADVFDGVLAVVSG